jgi:hypothetical protein
MFYKLLLLAALATNTLSAPSQQQSSRVVNVYWTTKGLARGPLALPLSFSLSPTLMTILDCTPSTIPTPSCSYEFIISATNAQPDFDCRLTDYGSPIAAQNNTLSDPRDNSFAAYPCNGDNAYSGGWQISWGYNSDHDSAVVGKLSFPL